MGVIFLSTVQRLFIMSSNHFLQISFICTILFFCDYQDEWNISWAFSPYSGNNLCTLFIVRETSYDQHLLGFCKVAIFLCKRAKFCDYHLATAISTFQVWLVVSLMTIFFVKEKLVSDLFSKSCVLFLCRLILWTFDEKLALRFNMLSGPPITQCNIINLVRYQHLPAPNHTGLPHSLTDF